MADEDNTNQGGAGGAEHPGKRGGKGRGERRPSERDLDSAVDRLSDDDVERLARRVEARRASRANQPSTPKLSHTLDALSAEEADSVIKACNEAREAINEADPKDRAKVETEVLADVEKVSGDVASAIRTNSQYRKQSLAHSLDVTARYLEHHHGNEAVEERGR